MHKPIATLSMWDTEVTKVSKKTRHNKVLYTVPYSFIADKGKVPQTIVLLDAPEEGQYILFGNPNTNNIYHSRDYEACLAVLPQVIEDEEKATNNWLVRRFMTSV